MEVIPLINAKNWMSELLPSMVIKPLNELVLPATHDSGAYYFNTCHPISSEASPYLGWSRILAIFPLIKSFVKSWTLTQEFSIYQQLEKGIRSFDLRLAHDGKEFWVVHTFTLVSLNSVLDQMNKFLLLNPSELIIVRVKPGWEQRSTMKGKASHLETILYTAFSTLLIPYANTLPTYQFCVNSNQRILFSYDYSEEENNLVMHLGSYLWPSNIFIGHWANTNNINVLKENINGFKNFPSVPGMFREVSFTLTPTSEDVKTSLLRFFTFRSHNSLKTFSEESNNLLLDMISKDERGFSNFSYISMDYPDDKCIEEIIKLNNI